MHLVGFIINNICYDARSHERKKGSLQVCLYTIRPVISWRPPPPLSPPAPSNTSAMKVAENTEKDPVYPEPKDEGDI